MAFHSILFILSLLVLTGCTQPINNRSTLGGVYRSPTFRHDTNAHTDLQTPSQHLLASTPKPRVDWLLTQYISPMDSVVHSPILAFSLAVKKTDPPRIYGLFPTIYDALFIPQTTTNLWINDVLITCNELGRSFIGSPYAFGYLTATGNLTKPLVGNGKRRGQDDVPITLSSACNVLRADRLDPRASRVLGLLVPGTAIEAEYVSHGRMAII